MFAFILLCQIPLPPALPELPEPVALVETLEGASLPVIQPVSVSAPARAAVCVNCAPQRQAQQVQYAKVDDGWYLGKRLRERRGRR